MPRYYLPKGDFPNPEQFIDEIVRNRLLNNIKLWLDKYCLFNENRNKFDLEGQIKLLRNRTLGIPSNIINLQNYNNYLQRVNSLCEALKMQGYHFPKPYVGVINWRLVVGLGKESVYETSITLHRNYSIPYIPGSAVKGVTRHWTIQKFAEEYQKSKNIKYEDAIKEVDKALENGSDLGIKVDEITFKEAIEIFGTQNKKGEVIFFDSLPILDENQNKDLIVLDVMNVHYGDYYGDKEGKIPPGDWMNPNPIFFLAVEKGTKFRFCVASKNKDLAEKTMELLKEAVKKSGIGAKTSAGYGYF